MILDQSHRILPQARIGVKEFQQPKMLIDNTPKLAEMEIEVAVVKAMQTKLVDLLAQVLTEREFVRSPTTAAALTIADVKTKVARLSEEIMRLQNKLNNVQIATDYTDNRGKSPIRTEQYRGGGAGIPLILGMPQFDSTEPQQRCAQTSFLSSANSQRLSKTPTAGEDAPACKIRLDLQGVIHEKSFFSNDPFAAVATVNTICVVQETNGNGGLCSLHFYGADSSRVLLKHDLRGMTFKTFRTRNGKLNVQWNLNGKPYYINFADWTSNPGQILCHVLEACGVPKLPEEGQKFSLFSSSSFAPFSSMFTTGAPSFYPGLSQTPAESVAQPSTQLSPKSKPGNTNARVDSQPVSTSGEFKFSSPAFKIETADKAKTDVPNAISGLRSGPPESEDPDPVIGGCPTLTNAPSTPIEANTTSTFSTPTIDFLTTIPSSFSFEYATGMDEQGEDSDDEDCSSSAFPRPVTELPQLVETKTGEEDEDVEFCERAKLYSYDTGTHKWKERGLGAMKILRNKTTGKYRVLMRREQVLKICANHQIIPGLKLMARSKPTEHTWAAPDFTGGNRENEVFAVRFGTKEQAEKFKKAFEEGLASAQSTTPAKPQASKADAPSTASQSNSLPLSALSKLPAGSWKCYECYVSNDSDARTCMACRTPNPSEATQPSSGASSGSAAITAPSELGVQAPRDAKEETATLEGAFKPFKPYQGSSTFGFPF